MGSATRLGRGWASARKGRFSRPEPIGDETEWCAGRPRKASWRHGCTGRCWRPCWPWPARRRPPRRVAPDCDTTGNSEILRTGKPITLSVNCFDADGDTVTLTHSTPAHGTLSAFVRNAQTGYFDATYTPSGSYTGPDAFNFTGARGEPELRDVRLRPDHHRQPRAPLRHRTATFHAKVGQTITIGFFCTDQDTQDQHLTYTPISAPAHGTLSNQQDFQVDYTPTAGYTGEDSFTLRASDGAPGRHLLPEAPRRQHAAVLDPAGRSRSARARAATSPSTARGPTTTSAPTATRSSPRRARARWRRPAPASTPSAPTPPTLAPPAPTRSPPAPPAPAATARP